MIRATVKKILKKLFPNPQQPSVDDEDGFVRATPSTTRTYSSFSGANIRAVITDEPFSYKTMKYADTWVSLLAIGWNMNNMGEGTLTAVELVLDGNEPPVLVGKYLTFVAANEYGKAAVLGAFEIKNITRISCGFSADDYVVERTLTLRGLYHAPSVGPLNLEALSESQD